MRSLLYNNKYTCMCNMKLSYKILLKSIINFSDSMSST